VFTCDSGLAVQSQHVWLLPQSAAVQWVNVQKEGKVPVGETRQ
jgi:hypothetical protein